MVILKTKHTPSIGSGTVQNVMVEKSIRHKWLNLFTLNIGTIEVLT